MDLAVGGTLAAVEEEEEEEDPAFNEAAAAAEGPVLGEEVVSVADHREARLRRALDRRLDSTVRDIRNSCKSFC